MSLDFDLRYEVKGLLNTVNAQTLYQLLQHEINKAAAEELVNVLTKRTLERLRGNIQATVGRKFKDITLNEYTSIADFELMKAGIIQDELNQKMPLLSRELANIFAGMAQDVKAAEAR